jgi:hypothetical protein
VKLPITRRQDELNYYNSPSLTVTIDGDLSFIRLHWKCLKLEFWTCRGEKGSGNGATDWVHTKIVILKPRKPYEGINDDAPAEWLRRLTWTCMRVGENSGTLFITDNLKLKYIINLETEAIEEIPRKLCTLQKHNLVPFEMDWPAFFMSRLEPKQKE